MKIVLLFLFTCVSLLELFVSGESVGKNSTSYSAFCQYDEDNGILLSRKKRFLTFPMGSAFASTLSIVKPLLFQQTTPSNLLLEYDVIWPIPSTEQLKKKARKAENRIFPNRIRKPSQWRLHRRHKRELYSVYEAALDSQGLPGKKCILRTICEARSVLSLPGVSFVEDILGIILSNFSRSRKERDEYDLAYESKGDCDSKYSCPFSILELLLSFDQDLVT